MQYFPIFAQLIQRPVLLVGGGHVALRKAQAMLQAGARLTVLATEFNDEFLKWQQEGKIELKQESFSAARLDGFFLAIAATDDSSVNEAVFMAANARQMLVNTVDDQPKCNFIFPSIIDRSPLLVAISTAGAAPVLARRWRERLEALLPQHLGPLAALAGRFRMQVKQRFQTFGSRRQFWERVFDSKVVQFFEANQPDNAEQHLQELLQEPDFQQGEVYIVGAGPGDPELLTLKALQLMQRADVIVHDQLVTPEILQLARRDAERVCVGKKAGGHSVSQAQINALLVERALKGEKVCRLKGGDPFIFGRGGEEVQVLRDAGIPFQVVPGITAAAGCAAYAGIPLTHRLYAQSVQFVTGHNKADGSSADWQSMSQPNQTLVLYMGAMKAANIQHQLMCAGRSAATPVAIVENGTRKNQRVVSGTLAELASLVERYKIISPSLLIIGEVAALGNELHWFGALQQQKTFQTISPQPSTVRYQNAR